MRYRHFRQRSTGLWLHAVVTISDGPFPVPPAVHGGEIAIGYGMAPDDVEVVEGDGPPPPVPGPTVTPLSPAPLLPREAARQRLLARDARAPVTPQAFHDLLL